MITLWTILLLIVLTLFWFKDPILDSQRDLSRVALSQQANVTVVRKSNETALYRNFMIPLQFALNTGLALSIGYKIRNGNFGDIWNAIMDITKSKKSFISFNNKQYSLPDINGMCFQFIKHLDLICNNININTNNDKSIKQENNAEEKPQKSTIVVGITVPATSLPGFIISVSCMIKSILCKKDDVMIIPQLVTMVPRSKQFNNIDILVINSEKDLQMLNDSKDWYSKIIVCDDTIVLNKDAINDSNVALWKDMIRNYSPVEAFEYTPPLDNSDELKPFINISSKYSNGITCFNQLNLVSSLSTFIKSFPLNHELNSDDVLTIINNPNDLEFQLQMWTKVFAVLIHGGSIIMENLDSSLLSSSSSSSSSSFTMNSIDQRSTLLFIDANKFKEMYEKDVFFSKRLDWLQSIKFTLAKLLLKSGILPNMFKSNIKSLRCVYLHYSMKKQDQISKFDFNAIPQKYKSGQFDDPLTIEDINKCRILLGSRISVELYCDTLVMGPISQTNFYDYRSLPKSTERQVTCFGAISLSLEGKFIETESNPQFDITKRQGMLCVRGFTIGKPLEMERIESATKLSENMAHGEGWMPLIGVYGLWGHDGCLYLFK